MRKHAAATDAVRTVTSLDGDVLRLARQAWEDGNKIGAKNGWRNAQASVLAPTGTIGFMMDCDTTGIEPDFSLVKVKKHLASISTKLLQQMGGASVMGPMLVGLEKSVQIAPLGAKMSEIYNAAVIAAYDINR